MVAFKSFNRDPEEFAGRNLPLAQGHAANSGGERGHARKYPPQLARRRGLPVGSVVVVDLSRQTPLRRG